MVILILLSILVAPFFVVRWLRWLAIVQQKEYRMDRIKAFLRSDEGRFELRRILPRSKDFSRTGLKRPKPTPRVLLVALLSGLTLLSQFTVSITHAFNSGDPNPIFLVWFVGVVAAYVVMPLTVIVDALPSIAISYFATWNTLRKAKKKIEVVDPKIIGVGGSYGKTSTKHLLHHFLSQKFSVFVTPKSFNNKLSVAQSILKGYDAQEIALLEYGAYIRGEIEYLAKWFQPDIAVETGFTPQHLSLFGSRENSILAESELIAALPKHGTVYCNGIDAGAVEICRTGASKNEAVIKMYSGEESLITLTDVGVNSHGQLHVKWHGEKIQTQLVGKQYLVNLQAAMLIAEEMGMTRQEIVAAATSFVPNSSFILGYEMTTGAYFIDDGGTSNPMGFAAALELLHDLPQKRKILLTAGMIDLGDESRQIHFQLAKRAKELGITVAHIGIDGHDEFVEVFEQELITDPAAAEVLITHAHEDAVILVEGKVPKALENVIASLLKK